MSHRTANITPGHLGALDASHQVIQDLSEVDGGERHDIRRLFYTTMIQSGVDHFRVYGEVPEYVMASQFLRERCSTANFDAVHKQVEAIHEFLQANLIKKQLTRKEDSAIHMLAYFFGDLFIAAKSGNAIASISEMPDPESLAALLRPDVLSVVRNLFASFSAVSVPSPVPKSEISSKDVSVFQEIILSDLFGEHARSQGQLEQADQSVEAAIKEAKGCALRLRNRFAQVLDLRSLAAKLVPATAAIAETLGGKIIGAAAKGVAEAVADLVGRERRIVLYSFFDVWEEIWQGRLRRIRHMLNQEREREGKR